ncbi:hypothetical protein KL909_003063 [Ogataea angusta]|nr:hypothetical protein KL909_003063 [Ogataea angusta]
MMPEIGNDSKSDTSAIFERNVQPLTGCPPQTCPPHWISDNYTCPILDSTVEFLSDQSSLETTEIVEYPHSVNLPSCRKCSRTSISEQTLSDFPSQLHLTQSLRFYSFSDLVEYELQNQSEERVCSATTLLMTRQRQLSETSFYIAC